jgi:hypothetical protein
VIGWLILAAVLIPALALGRWAERERRKVQARMEPQPRAEVATRPARTLRHVHAPGWPARSSLTAGRAVRRTAARRPRPFAER